MVPINVTTDEQEREREKKVREFKEYIESHKSSLTGLATEPSNKQRWARERFAQRHGLAGSESESGAVTPTQEDSRTFSVPYHFKSGLPTLDENADFQLVFRPKPAAASVSAGASTPGEPTPSTSGAHTPTSGAGSSVIYTPYSEAPITEAEYQDFLESGQADKAWQMGMNYLEDQEKVKGDLPKRLGERLGCVYNMSVMLRDLPSLYDEVMSDKARDDLSGRAEAFEALMADEAVDGPKFVRSIKAAQDFFHGDDDIADTLTFAVLTESPIVSEDIMVKILGGHQDFFWGGQSEDDGDSHLGDIGDMLTNSCTCGDAAEGSSLWWSSHAGTPRSRATSRATTRRLSVGSAVSRTLTPKGTNPKPYKRSRLSSEAAPEEDSENGQNGVPDEAGA